MNNRNTTCVALPMYFWCTSVNYLVFHVVPNSPIIIDSCLHTSKFSISGFRGYRWLYLYFPSDRNANNSTNNAQNFPPYVDNYSMIRILITFPDSSGLCSLQIDYQSM